MFSQLSIHGGNQLSKASLRQKGEEQLWKIPNIEVLSLTAAAQPWRHKYMLEIRECEIAGERERESIYRSYNTSIKLKTQ